MDWLLHNPIADLPGPSFLLLYGSLVGVALPAFWAWIASRDSTAELEPLEIPLNPDPREVAYLRGGVNELARLVVFDILQRGILQRREKRELLGLSRRDQIAQAESSLPRGTLTPIEARVFDWFIVPRDAAEIFHRRFTDPLKFECRDYDRRLEAEQLLAPAEQNAARMTAAISGVFLVLGLAGYKISVGLAKGHTSVLFLIGMALASGFGLMFVCRERRVSNRGRRYLADLKQAFERLKTRTAIDAAGSGESSPDLVLLCSVFGVAALAATPYAYYRDMFARGAYSGGDTGFSFGGGCGGGGCGGGGCGGGCGGCGG